MELDELIRTTRFDVGRAPSVASLRGQLQRRRHRRRTIATFVVVVLVGVAGAIGGVRAWDGRDHSSVVSVQPGPIQPDPSRPGTPAWDEVATLPASAVVAPTAARTGVRMVTVGDRLVVASYSAEYVNVDDRRPVKVAAVDPVTGAVGDLGFGTELAEVPNVFGGIAGWGDGFVIAAEAGDQWQLHQWRDAAWSLLDLPVSAEQMGPTTHWQVVSVADDLVAIATTPEMSSANIDRLWRTSDGVEWIPISSPTAQGGSAFEGGDRLLRRVWAGSSATSAIADLWNPQTGEWIRIPPPAAATSGYQHGVLSDGTEVSCGVAVSRSRYDCGNWSRNDDTQRPTDPPPLPQAVAGEGFGEGLQVVNSGDGRVVVGDGYVDRGPGRVSWAVYDIGLDSWQLLPAPEGDVTVALDSVQLGEAVYVAFADGDSSISLQRLTLGDGSGNHELDVPRARDAGEGRVVRLPADGWSMVVSDDDSTVTVAASGTITIPGATCPALAVEFVELESSVDTFPWPGTDEMTPASTEPCVPAEFKVWGNDRAFLVRVHRAYRPTPADAADLATILGSFRAASR